MISIIIHNFDSFESQTSGEKISKSTRGARDIAS